MVMLRRMAPIAAAALLVSACTSVIMTGQLHRANSNSFFNYWAGRGEMLAVVVGNPFPVSKEVLDRAVTDAMQGNHNGPLTRFSTDPGPKADCNSRIVVAFDLPKTMHVRVLCENAAAIPTSGREAGKLRADFAFCIESDIYSSVSASMPGVDSIGDPRFRQMIAGAMWSLIPAVDPLSSDQGQCIGPGC